MLLDTRTRLRTTEPGRAQLGRPCGPSSEVGGYHFEIREWASAQPAASTRRRAWHGDVPLDLPLLELPTAVLANQFVHVGGQLQEVDAVVRLVGHHESALADPGRAI